MNSSTDYVRKYHLLIETFKYLRYLAPCSEGSYMKESKFYYAVFVLSAAIFLILGKILGQLNGNLFLSQLVLIPCILIIFLVGAYGSVKSQSWTTKVFLQLFALSALDGLLLISYYRSYYLYGMVALAFIGFIIVFRNLQLYKTKNVVEELEKEVDELEHAQKEANEMISEVKSKKAKIQKTTPKKAKSTNVQKVKTKTVSKKKNKFDISEIEREVAELEQAQKEADKLVKAAKAARIKKLKTKYKPKVKAKKISKKKNKNKDAFY